MLGEFTAATGLADAFGRVPATFRAEYLGGREAALHRFHPDRARGHGRSAALVFAEKEPLGYVSDHIGLRARLSLTPGTTGTAVS